MEHIGLIIAEPDPPGIDYDRWISIIDEHPHLRQMEATEGINPFTRKRHLYERPYSAWILLDGESIGSMCWEADAIHVSGAHELVIQVAVSIASTLGGQFRKMDDLET